MKYLMQLHPSVQSALARISGSPVVRSHADCNPSIKSPADFAQALNIAPAQITKSIFIQEQGEQKRAVVACASSTQRINLKTISQILGYGRLEFASPEELQQQLGYPKHGVSPLGVPKHIPVVMDRTLLQYPKVLIGGGVAGFEIEISPQELRDAAGALIEEISA